MPSAETTTSAPGQMSWPNPIEEDKSRTSAADTTFIFEGNKT